MKHPSLWLLVATAAVALAGSDGPPENRVTLDLEPTAEHPRNSEGAFATLRSGRVVFYYTEFYGGSRDDSPAHIVRIHSDDRGRSWSEPQVVVKNDDGRNVMSVSLLRLQGGRLALFYLVKQSWLDCRPRLRLSDDDGETWSEPRLVIDAPGYFVLNNDRVIQTGKGRLIVPVAFHRARGSDPGRSASFDSRAIALWYLSDDEGASWREAASWWAMPVASHSGLQEPGVVETADQSLLSWARTDQGAQWGFESSDGGKTWSAPAATALKSPVSPASIKRLPDSGKLLCLYNDHSGRFPFADQKRTPLVAALSADGGKTWPWRKSVEGDLEGWYCYTAIHFVDDAVLLAYCAGDKKVGGLNRLRLRRLARSWFETAE